MPSLGPSSSEVATPAFALLTSILGNQSLSLALACERASEHYSSRFQAAVSAEYEKEFLDPESGGSKDGNLRQQMSASVSLSPYFLQSSEVLSSKSFHDSQITITSHENQFEPPIRDRLGLA